MAGPQDPASNTMTVFQYSAGARTRNVVNIASPGGTTAAYQFAATSGVPMTATDGFPNFHSQKTLHVLIDNNRNTGSAVLKFWFYNSSGIERFAVQATTVGGASGTCDVYLGTNTI
jgi:hypothetical protein